MDSLEPPPIFEAEPPPLVVDIDTAESSRRVPLGWVLVVFIFAVLGLGTYLTLSQPASSREADPFFQEESSLREAMNARSFLNYLGHSKEARSKEQDSIDSKMLDDLAAKSDQDLRAARLLVVAKRELGDPVTPKDLSRLQVSPAPADSAFLAVYSSKTLTPAQAEDLSKRLPDTDFSYKVARVHAHDLARDAGYRAKFAPAWKGGTSSAILFTALVLAVIGVGLWRYYLSARKAGFLIPEGHPVEPLTLGEADRLGMRAGLFMLAFLLTELFVFRALRSFSPGIQDLGASLVVAGVIVLLLFVPIAGVNFSLARIGLRSSNLKRDILWGLAGYVAVLPLLAFALIVGNVLMKFFGPSTHPATELLSTSPSLANALEIFLAASILAPFTEEIIFRGTLLPAISRVFNKQWVGVLLSSFLFASLHPQGVPLWLGLGLIGAMNCMLAYQTKSLVPCMVLHFVHNTAILILIVVVS